MNTHRVGLASAQKIVQTGLLIVVSLVGTWLALYRVPWRVSADPCLIAAAAMGVIVICLWLRRWQGVRGLIFERYLLGRIPRVHGACICNALPLRPHRRCSEPSKTFGDALSHWR